MATRSNILIIGAFDRFNYGDLLFPLVIEAQLRTYEQSFDAAFFGIVKSDLSALGGKPTEDIRAFYRRCQDDAQYTSVIVAGGEAVAVSWSSLLLALNSVFKRTHRFHRRINKVLDLNRLAKRLLHGRTDLPFVFTRSEFPRVDRLIFNSLGGSELVPEVFDRYPGLRDDLRQVDYFAVRDETTQRRLATQGIKTLLYPDSAILMSKFYPASVLAGNVSPQIGQYVTERRGDYLFFQIKNNHAKNHEPAIAQQLNAIVERYPDVQLCLCPIGKALNHDDHLALQRVAPLLRHPYTLFDDVTIWDIMFLIAHAKVYMGTSLHGAITAMSYAVPYVGMVVPKLDSYLRTWGVSGIHQVVSLTQLREGFEQAIQVDKASLNQSREEQISAAEDSFLQIKRLVLPE